MEVKSAVSDGLERDYERGLYQVVKYKAVLEAQAQIDCPVHPPEVKVFLVLESRLPQKYLEVARRLEIIVKEHIKPASFIG